MGRNRSGSDDPSRRGRARRGVHAAPKGVYDLRLKIPPADQLGTYRQVFSGPHYGWQVTDPDPNTRIATHPAKPDDLGSFACDLGISALVLDRAKQFDGLWVRQNTGASTARIWIYTEARFIFEAFKAFLVDPLTGLPWSTTNRLPTAPGNASGIFSTANPLATNLRQINGIIQNGGQIDVWLPLRNANAQVPKSVIVGTTEAEAIAGATNFFIYFRNASTGNKRISLSWSGAAVIDKGITLSPGEHISFDKASEVFVPFTRATRAVASAAGAVLAIQESQ